MSRSRPVTVSKFLAKHLRHTPEAIGLTLDPSGWAEVEELLAASARVGFPITAEELDAAVHAPGKRRYAFDAERRRVRAVQGHSADVDLGLDPVDPPPVLFHGTHPGARDAIRAQGLRPMGRRHVHLSGDRETARAVGARRGRPLILEVEAWAMARDGHAFFRAENGVWLTDTVPPQYVKGSDPSVAAE